ncbi:MAG TPA: hypothetical protein DEA43_03645 [Candidatus Moranbacteria bacterium]|nr:hypothetical protein [Candidatus Moranbacteria bacterium]HBI33912.1 hypothetical protein [Candidatus Moranbacteria bacterium]HBT45950.1 hypothetical protein [Candidatus Moranbacteria bacterium]
MKIKQKIFLLIFFLTFGTFSFCDAKAALTLVETGTEREKIISIESTGQFGLVFKASINGGIAEWYDLVNDPDKTRNLHQGGNGMIGAVWGNANPTIDFPDDPKLYFSVAGYPDQQPELTAVENTPSRVVIKTVGHPLLDWGVATSVLCTTYYYIYPDGKIYLSFTTHYDNSVTLKPGSWRYFIYIYDPYYVASDNVYNVGWKLCNNHQCPEADWFSSFAYQFMYWNSEQTADRGLSDWTKASALLVPASDPLVGGYNFHSWDHWKHLSYNYVGSTSIPADSTYTFNFLVQLGTQGSLLLPDINSALVAEPIANAYLDNPTPPSEDLIAPAPPSGFTVL